MVACTRPADRRSARGWPRSQVRHAGADSPRSSTIAGHRSPRRARGGREQRRADQRADHDGDGRRGVRQRGTRPGRGRTPRRPGCQVMPRLPTGRLVAQAEHPRRRESRVRGGSTPVGTVAALDRSRHSYAGITRTGSGGRRRISRPLSRCAELPRCHRRASPRRRAGTTARRRSSARAPAWLELSRPRRPAGLADHRRPARARRPSPTTSTASYPWADSQEATVSDGTDPADDEHLPVRAHPLQWVRKSLTGTCTACGACPRHSSGSRTSSRKPSAGTRRRHLTDMTGIHAAPPRRT